MPGRENRKEGCIYDWIALLCLRLLRSDLACVELCTVYATVLEWLSCWLSCVKKSCICGDSCMHSEGHECFVDCLCNKSLPSHVHTV